MPDHAIIADAYIDLWNEVDETARMQTFNRGWTSDTVYTDPFTQAVGTAKVSQLISATQSRFRGHRFQLVGTPDGHGTFVRFSWNLVSSDNLHVVRGTDIVWLDENRRIKCVIGFIDNLKT